jgi:hypothetical protein
LGFKIFEVATRDDVGYVLAKATTCSYWCLNDSSMVEPFERN